MLDSNFSSYQYDYPTGEPSNTLRLDFSNKTAFDVPWNCGEIPKRNGKCKIDQSDSCFKGEHFGWENLKQNICQCLELYIS